MALRTEIEGVWVFLVVQEIMGNVVWVVRFYLLYITLPAVFEGYCTGVDITKTKIQKQKQASKG